MAVPYPRLFSHLAKNCRPIADKTRKYSKEDADFIRAETQRLLLEDIIERPLRKSQSTNRKLNIHRPKFRYWAMKFASDILYPILSEYNLCLICRSLKAAESFSV